MSGHNRVPIQVDGQKLVLCYDLNALIFLEDAAGTDIARLDEAVEACRVANTVDMTNLKLLRMTFYAGLRREQPELTEEDAGKLIFLDNAAEVSEAVGKAMSVNAVNNATKSEEGLHDDSPLSPASVEAPGPSGPQRSSTTASRRTKPEASLSATASS